MSSANFRQVSKPKDVQNRNSNVKLENIFNIVKLSQNVKPLIIAIAGPSGARKTVITQALSKKLKDAVTLYFDDYELHQNQDWFLFDGDMEALDSWIHEGFDPNKWETPELVQHLKN